MTSYYLAVFGTVVLLWMLPGSSSSFSLPSGNPPSVTERSKATNLLASRDVNCDSCHDLMEKATSGSFSSRRRNLFLASAKMILGTTATALVGSATPVHAEEEKTIWLSKVPGKKPRDKGDYSGTKKDPKFLRSISDCKSQCENTPGPDGLARSKEDCLSDCQDICCTTYEQCTFAIVPRI